MQLKILGGGARARAEAGMSRPWVTMFSDGS